MEDDYCRDQDETVVYNEDITYHSDDSVCGDDCLDMQEEEDNTEDTQLIWTQGDMTVDS